MACGLVGTIGTVVSGASPQTPAFGAGENRTANNLLICWAWSTSGGVVTTPTGFSVARTIDDSVGNSNLYIFYKVAVGNEASTVSVASTAGVFAQVGEFAGVLPVSPLDQTGPASFANSTSGTQTATAANPDAQPGELVVYLGEASYSVAALETLSNALNNGGSTNDSTNNAASTSSHHAFGWGITTANAAADTVTLTYPTTAIVSSATIVASFLLAPATHVVRAFLPSMGPQGMLAG